MRISLTIVAAIVIMQCGINDGGRKIDELLMQEPRSSEQEHKEIEQKLEEFKAKERIYNANVDNFIFKTIPEGSTRRILLEGDTVLSEKAEQMLKDVVYGTRTKRQVLKTVPIWEDGVFYMFYPLDEQVRTAFILGAKVWADSTCVEFMENKTAKDKVIVIEGGGSWSSVGRTGGNQYLSLNDFPTIGTAVHEIGHVLGLLHTMSRHDRDGYIEILWQNVDPSSVGDFEKESENETDVYGLMYDYGSIMHYNELSGSGNHQPTMIAKDAHYQKTMGSEIISFSDIFTVNMRYGCNGRCNESTSANCANEGFPHPRNCSICICPSGYGGDLCDRRPPGCGEDLEAKSEKQTVNSTLGVGSRLRDLFEFCYYMILAPRGKKVELQAELISHGFEKPGCPRGGIEIKAQIDRKMTGYRICSRKGTVVPIVSTYNHLPVILFNRRNAHSLTDCCVAIHHHSECIHHPKQLQQRWVANYLTKA